VIARQGKGGEKPPRQVQESESPGVPPYGDGREKKRKQAALPASFIDRRKGEKGGKTAISSTNKQTNRGVPAADMSAILAKRKKGDEGLWLRRFFRKEKKRGKKHRRPDLPGMSTGGGKEKWRSIRTKNQSAILRLMMGGKKGDEVTPCSERRPKWGREACSAKSDV